MSTLIIYFFAFILAWLNGFLAVKIQLKFATAILALFPFVAFTLYLNVCLEMLEPTGESAGVPMLPIVYITLCLPFAFVSVLAFLCFGKRIVV